MRDQATGLSALLEKLVHSLFTLSAVAILSTPAMAQLEITEVMFDPNDSGEWEWIEVRNTGAGDVDLDGWLGFTMNQQEVTGPNPTIISSPDAPNTMIEAGAVAVIYDGFHGGGRPGTFDDAQFREAWGLAETVPLLSASFFPGLSSSPGSGIGFWANETDYMADLGPVEDPNNPGEFITRTVQFTNAQFSVTYAGPDYPNGNGMSSVTWTGQGDRNNGANWVLSEENKAGGVLSLQVNVGDSANNTNEVANPGIVTTNGTPANDNLMITEVMYDSGSTPDDAWEWIEIYNPSDDAVDLAGWVVDDNNSVAHSEANIAAGSIEADGTAILFNVDVTSPEDFATAWGSELNLVPVTDWGAMQLNNSGDTIALWENATVYEGDNELHSNAEVSFTYSDDPNNSDFPGATGLESITLTDLSAPNDGLKWDQSDTIDGDSFNASPVGDSTVFHPGGDIGSPGTFVVQSGPADVDLDDDGDVDGADFLALQRTNPSLLGEWQAQFGSSSESLAATAAVPEPTTLVLCGLATVMLPLVRRQRA